MVSPDFSAVDYRPSGSSNGYQTFDLYLPSGVAPSAGWPVVVILNHDSWTTSSRAGSITGGIALRMLHSGMAVCNATATVVDTSDPSIIGGGMFWDPGDSGWSTDDTPEHDLAWVIQKLRDNASTYNIDGANIGLYCTAGSSSTIGANVAMSQDLANSGASTTQEQQSSLVQCAVLRDFLAYYPAVQSSYAPVRLRDASSPSTQAASISAASSAHSLQASPLYRLAVATNAGTDHGKVPFYVRSTGSPASTNFEFSTIGVPKLSNTIPNDTDTWGQIMVVSYLRKYVGLVRQNRNSKHSADIDLLAEGVDYNIASGDAEELYAERFLRASLVGGGSALTFSVPCIGWDWSVESDRRGISTGNTSAAMVRRQVRTASPEASGTAEGRVWSLNWPKATSSDVANLENIALASHGPVSPMNFAPPDEPGTVLVRIRRGTFRVTQENAVRFSMSLELEEVA